MATEKQWTSHERFLAIRDLRRGGATFEQCAGHFDPYVSREYIRQIWNRFATDEDRAVFASTPAGRVAHVYATPRASRDKLMAELTNGN